MYNGIRNSDRKAGLFKVRFEYVIYEKNIHWEVQIESSIGDFEGKQNAFAVGI